MNKKLLMNLQALLICLIFNFSFAQDGEVDATFNAIINPASGNHISTISKTYDNKLIIAGSFSQVNSVIKNNIARITMNGSLDTQFIGLNSIDGSIWTTEIQSDNKILIGGSFKNINNNSKLFIARLNENGTLDTSFNPIIDTNSIFNKITDVKIQSDGKIIIAGWFSSINGSIRSKIARLNSDGTLDNTFTPPNFGNNGFINCVSIQNDGKMLIGGTVLNLNGSSNIFRLNQDGTIDNTFLVGAGANNEINDINIGTDGFIYVIGKFTTFNSQNFSRIVKLNSNGSIVNNFSTQITFDPLASVLQNDGKLLITGYQKVQRLNLNGTVDSTFNNGVGPNIYGYCLFLDQQSLFVGGDFSYINNLNIPKLAKLKMPSQTLAVSDSKNKMLTVFPNPTSDLIFIRGNKEFIKYEIRDYSGKLLENSKLFDNAISMRKYPVGIYYITLMSNTNKLTQKILVK